MATDFSEFDKLSIDLTSASDEVIPFVVLATKVSSHKIRDDAREEAARSGLEAYGQSIGYDVTHRATAIRGEIGPTRGRRQSSFGFVENAGGKVRSAPQHALRDAKKANEPDYFDGIEKALADGMDKAVGG